MNNHTNADFWGMYSKLPKELKAASKEKFKLFLKDPRHPSLIQTIKEGSGLVVRSGQYFDTRSLLQEGRGSLLVLDWNSRGIRPRL